MVLFIHNGEKGKFRMDNTPDLPCSGGKPWSIGQEWDSSTNETDEFDGDIAEFLVFDEVMAEKVEIRSYLAKKWNLESEVDSDGDGIVDEHDIDPVDPDKWVEFPNALRQSEADAHTPIDGLALWLDAANINGNNNSGLNRRLQCQPVDGFEWQPVSSQRTRQQQVANLSRQRTGFQW